MRIALCDDEEIFRASLIEKINKVYKDDIDIIVRPFSNGVDFLSYYFSDNNSDAYDMIFLDIEMGKLNGIEVAKEIRKINKDVAIVFLTSHDEFAKDGYEVNAFRYLSKPIQEDKLIEAIESVKKSISLSEKILVHNKEEEVLLKVSDILYLEAQNKDIYIHTLDKIYSEKNKMSFYENLLKEFGFFRTHRSYLVNFNYVKSYKMNEIIMDNLEKVYLSRLKYKRFKEQLYLYVKRTAR